MKSLIFLLNTAQKNWFDMDCFQEHFLCDITNTLKRYMAFQCPVHNPDFYLQSKLEEKYTLDFSDNRKEEENVRFPKMILKKEKRRKLHGKNC